jgi:hypothetical protein
VENTLKVKNMEKVNMNGQMGHIMMEIGKIIKLMVLVHINGQMEEVIQENG